MKLANRKGLFGILFVLLLMGQCLAQNPRDRIQAARVGFITNRLNLTTDQSTKFWPLYNEYNQKKTTLRKSLRKQRREPVAPAATDDQIRQNLQQMLGLRQQEVDLEKEYTRKFMQVVSPRQVADLYKAEQDFTAMMLSRMKDRKTERKRN